MNFTNKRLGEEPTNSVELRAFFGLLLLLGVTGKNDVDVAEIWSFDSVHHLTWATVAMPRNRFQFLINKITFDDIETRAFRFKNVGKFYLINEIFDAVRTKVKSALNPGMDLAVDETLYAYRGRCSFRQYMKSKPNKYGIKYWSIGCVSSGYLCDFSIYLGKSKESESRTIKLGEKVLNLL